MASPYVENAISIIIERAVKEVKGKEEMPSRNCRTRPVGWRIANNKRLADAVNEGGWIVAWVHENILVSVDNLGRMEGGKYQLRDMFFPHHPEITPDDVDKVIQLLHNHGLIIRYIRNHIGYIALPKIGKWSKMTGNMKEDSDFPPPSIEVIKHWEERFNEVYTMYEQSINKVCSEDKDKDKDKGKDKDKAITDFFNYFCLKVDKRLKLTNERETIIIKRLKEYTLNDLKRAVDSFVQDDWADRHKYIDVVYCIGKQKGKRDNLEHWLNWKPNKNFHLTPAQQHTKEGIRDFLGDDNAK